MSRHKRLRFITILFGVHARVSFEINTLQTKDVLLFVFLARMLLALLKVAEGHQTPLNRAANKTMRNLRNREDKR